MKIGILLHSFKPSYRGGVNSFVHGLLNGLKKTDHNNQYYLFSCESGRQALAKYLGGNFQLIGAPDAGQSLKKIGQKIIGQAYWPMVNNFYLTIEKILYGKIIGQINNLNLDVCYSPLTPQFPININHPAFYSIHDIQQIHYPQYFSAFALRQRAVTYRLSAERAVLVQASSVFMKNDLLKKF